ncbi:MAG: HEAT repeat domain-containing protein [Planctomycetota bacterium]|jgi:hypothetical protein
MRPTTLLLVGALVLVVAAPVHAQAKNSKETPDPKVTEVDKDKAKELLDKLDKAKRSKETNKIVKALEPFVAHSSEKFVKPLEKLLKHKEAAVRVMAVRALGSQGPAKKIGPVLYSVVLDKAKRNRKSPAVIGQAISSLRRLRFDKKPVVDEIMGQFRKNVHASIMKECARYFGDLRRKDTVTMLVYWVEAPEPGDIHNPNNPPSAYWERLWNIWDEIRDSVLEALRKITGKEFTTTKGWQSWLRTPEAKRLKLK